MAADGMKKITVMSTCIFHDGYGGSITQIAQTKNDTINRFAC
jgi:hypothetical protein